MQNKVEPEVRLLTVLVVFFTLAVFAARWLFPSDAGMFAAISTPMGAAWGALYLRIRSGKDQDSNGKGQPGETAN